MINENGKKVKEESGLSFRSLEWQENEKISTGGKTGKKGRKSEKK